MSDLISRKALVNTIKKNCYPIRYDRCSEENGMTVTGIMQAINEQPTAFDLESVIEQLKDKVSHAEQKAAEYDEIGKIEMMDIWDTEAKSYRNALEILKSAANATNGKNGG